MMTVTAWCKAVGISRSGFYALGADRAPSRGSGEGYRLMVIESPYLWLERVKGIKLPAGGVPPVAAAAAPVPVQVVDKPAVDWPARAREVGETQAIKEMRAERLRLK